MGKQKKTIQEALVVGVPVVSEWRIRQSPHNIGLALVGFYKNAEAVKLAFPEGNNLPHYAFMDIQLNEESQLRALGLEVITISGQSTHSPNVLSYEGLHLNRK